MPPDATAAPIPQLSCPGLVSRSQSALSSEDGQSRRSGVRPTLLTTGKALSPTKDGRKIDKGSAPTSPRDLESTLAFTTATSEEVGSPANAQQQGFGCCTGRSYTTSDSEWLWDASASAGKAAWNGGKEVALFVGNQLYTAATVAQPHVESLASSAAGALQSAAESTMDSIRELGPRKPRARLPLDLPRRRSKGLQAPVLQTPTLPPLPELDAFTGPMGFAINPSLPTFAQGSWHPGMDFLPEMQARSEYFPREARTGAQRLMSSHSFQVSQAQPPMPSMPSMPSFPSVHSFHSDVSWQPRQSLHPVLPQLRPQPPLQQLQPALTFAHSRSLNPDVTYATVLRCTTGERRPLSQSRIVSA